MARSGRAAPICSFATRKTSVAVAERPRIAVGKQFLRWRIVTVALKATEGGQRALLNTELHYRTIRTERMRTLGGVRELIVRISKRRVAGPAGPKVFLTERPCGCGGQRNCCRGNQGNRREPKLGQSKHHDHPPKSAPPNHELQPTGKINATSRQSPWFEKRFAKISLKSGRSRDLRDNRSILRNCCRRWDTAPRKGPISVRLSR